jgi:hypothetical protein
VSHERRRHVRAPLTVTAQMTLFAEERCLGTFAVLNLSAGGALAAGHAPRGASRKLTAILELGAARPLRAEATITRDDRQGEPCFAVTFTRLSASAEDALQAAVLATLEEARAASVLIVAPPTGVERCLARDLKRLGRSSFHVSSASDAMHFFEMQNGVNLTFIDERLDQRQHAGEAALPALLRFFAESHPEVMRVLFSAAAPGHARPESMLLIEVEHLLHTPASSHELRRILQLRPHRRAAAEAALAPAARIH